MKVYIEALKIRIKDENDFVTIVTDFEEAVQQCKNAISFHKEIEKKHKSDSNQIIFPKSHKQFKNTLQALKEFAQSNADSKCDSSLCSIIEKRAFWGFNIFQARERFGCAEVFVYDWKGKFLESFFIKSKKEFKTKNPTLYKYTGDLDDSRIEEFFKAFHHNTIWKD